MSFDEAGNRERVAALRLRGVDVWGPERVYIGSEVNLDWIAPGAEIRHATLAGASLRIGRGSKIGASGHALLEDCQIGRDVTLGAGSYRGATLLEGVGVREFAELRPGTLLEEKVEAAHCVAFKNTILTAGCVAGSLINFCDIFMCGGSSREDHSEIGSGAIHFNFDPRGDKWGSLVGDVRSVLLRSAPVFVGGHCGIAGPGHIDFGAVTAAGSVIRKDVPADVISFEGVTDGEITGFDREIYAGLRRKFLATAKLIGNLWAFDRWYDAVRIPYATADERPLYEAARGQAGVHVRERVKRLAKIIDKLPRSIEKAEKCGDAKLQRYIAEHRALIDRWASLERALATRPDSPEPPPAFIECYAAARSAGESHLDAAQSCHAGADDSALWLARIADSVRQKAEATFPSAETS